MLLQYGRGTISAQNVLTDGALNLLITQLKNGNKNVFRFIGFAVFSSIMVF